MLNYAGLLLDCLKSKVLASYQPVMGVHKTYGDLIIVIIFTTPMSIKRLSLLLLILPWLAERYLPSTGELSSKLVCPQQGWPRYSTPQEQQTREAPQNEEVPEL